MQSKNRLRFTGMVLFIMLALPALACGPTSLFEPPATETPVPTPTPAATPTPEPEETFDFEGLDEGNFSAQFVIEVDGTDPSGASMGMMMAGQFDYQAEPVVMFMALEEFSFSGEGETFDFSEMGAENIRLTITEEDTYLQMEFDGEEFCVVNANDEQASELDFTPFDPSLFTESDFAESEEFEFVGEEEVNGLNTYHYRAEGITYEEFEGEANFDLWYSPEKDTIVRVEMTMDFAETEEIGQGTLTMSMDLEPVDNLEIPIPQNCIREGFSDS